MALFNWNLSAEETSTPTKITVQRPAERNYTENLVANTALTKGLYHNTYPGLRLAGSMAFPPIAVPVWFMGNPVCRPSDENDSALEDVIKEITDSMASEFEKIHTISHRDGTCWIWPFFDSKTMSLRWEFIDDDSVVDIVKDLITGDPIKIITEELVTLKTDYNTTGKVKIRRTFTDKKIEYMYTDKSGSGVNQLLNKSQRNILGILPICFSNNREANRVRGHSDYERFLPDLKSYHDIEQKMLELMTKFNVKMVQKVKNFETWKGNLFETQGITTFADFDIAATDLLINEPEEESAFVFPQGAFDAAEKKLSTIYKKIVEASGVPEIVWGLKTEGNRASVEESVSGLIRYVQNKQDQKTDAYYELFMASIRLIYISRGIMTEPEIVVSWNDMDSISEEVKSIIFKNYAEGISKLIAGASITKQQMFNLYKQAFPKITEEDFDKFVIGLSDTAAFNQFKNMPYEQGRDYTTVTNDTGGI